MRPQEGQAQSQPITYGDVFNVQGKLAHQPIAPRDAAMMQSAEHLVMGHTPKSGPAARNEKARFVGHQEVSDGLAARGASIAETHLPGRRLLTESIAGQVLKRLLVNDENNLTCGGGEYEMPESAGKAVAAGGGRGGARGRDSAMTTGEALEASARTAGDKPVDRSDAAAIQAAEARATGTAPAQAAADASARITGDEDKTKLADVLSNATAKLPVDKVVTRADAERVMGAEMRNDPEMATRPGGVAASVVEAARCNQNWK